MGLFDEQVARRPDNYPWANEFIDKIWTGFWTPNEFNFKGDYGQFYTELSLEEQRVITRTLSAIAQVEIAVKRFWADLGKHLPHPSINDLGLVMANSEVIHNKAYEKLIDVLRLQDVFEENLKVPVFRDRVKYLQKYNKRVYKDDYRKQYIYSIILFTLFVENVSLFSQFYTILYFNRFKNVLKDTAQQVQYTRNEELLHAQIGIKIINTLREEYPELFDEELEERIREETYEAFEAEHRLIEWMLEDFKEDSLNIGVLSQYTASRMDDSLKSIGFSSHFDLPTPEKAKWMEEEQFGNNMTDFFHKRPVEYARHNKSYGIEELF